MNTKFKAGTLIAALIASSLLLSGCGNKGPLVLPTAPVEVPPPDAAPAEPTDATAPEAPTPVEEKQSEEGQPEEEPATPPSDDGNG